MHQKSSTVIDPFTTEGAALMWKLNDERNKGKQSIMSKVQIKSKPIEVPPIESVTLTLNEAEYTTLLTVLRHVGGSPAYSPRQHVDQILSSMRMAEQALMPKRGYTQLEAPREVSCAEYALAEGSIFFHNYIKEN